MKSTDKNITNGRQGSKLRKVAYIGFYRLANDHCSILTSLLTSIFIVASPPASAQWSWLSNLPPFLKSEKASEKPKSVAKKKRVDATQMSATQSQNPHSSLPIPSQDASLPSSLPSDNIDLLKPGTSEGQVKVAILDLEMHSVTAQQVSSPSDNASTLDVKEKNPPLPSSSNPPKQLDLQPKAPSRIGMAQNETLLELPPQSLIKPTSISANEWFEEKKSKESRVGDANLLIDPTTDKGESWTKMEVSADLPPRVRILGEDLIGSVIKQLPDQKKKRAAMPFDEFRVRVHDAVLAYPDIGVADSQLMQAKAGKSEALAGLLPVVQGTSESGKRTVGRDSYLGTPGYSRDGATYGVSVRQVLFDFGAAYFGFSAGQARERAAQELLNSKRSEQALKTVSTFIDLERARSQMSLAQENASSRLAIVKLVRERYMLGGGAKPDIIRAEARYADALANVTTAQNRLKTAEAAYRETFSTNPLGMVNGPNYEIPLDGLNKTATELAANYPGLLQLTNLRDAAKKDANSLYAKLLPSFNFAYNNTVNGISAPLAPSRSTSAVVQMSVNLFSGGAEMARQSQAEYKAIQAEYELQSGLRQFEKAISQNQEEVRNSEQLLNARKVAAISAVDSMRAVREQFAFNKGSLLDLMTVQEGLYNAGRDLVDAEADRQISRYRLLHLTSGLDKLFDLSDSKLIAAE